MLKYENVANIGDTIKAFDFEPMEGRDDSFLIGKVVAKGMIHETVDGLEFPLYKAYTVKVIGGDDDSRNGKMMWVPFESSMDYEGRVTKVEQSDDDLAEIGKQIVAQATVKTSKTKKQAAAELFEQFGHKGRKYVIDLYMTELNMSKAGASTYYQNAKKGA